MKIICFVLAFFVSMPAFTQTDFKGDWRGKIAAFNLTIVFHIAESNGTFTATMDSPDQGVNGIPASAVKVTGNDIQISFATIGAEFKGSYSASEQTITGKWSQGGGAYDVALGRNAAPAAKEKPQTPKPPFPYNTKEVAYDKADGSAHLEGTLSYPLSGTGFPAVILVTGSGQQDRDETIMGHKPFAVLADHLTKMGFAVLRVDDRGVGKSTGDVRNATSADFAADVNSGIDFLKKNKIVDANRIGIIGHSEGGLIAALVAAERKDIAFMVLLAGPGIPGATLLAEQGKETLLKSGLPEKAVEAYLPFYKAVIALSAAGTDSSSFAVKLRGLFNDWKQKTDPLLVQHMGFVDDASTDGILENLLDGFSGKWMQYFLATDPAPYLKKTNAKVLALNGEKDIQVLAASNTAGIRKALEGSKSPLFEVKVLPGLNHLFQRCTLCTIPEYGSLEETINAAALEAVGSWLQKNVLQR